MKLKLPSNIYSKIYPTGSAPCKFYGTARIHKLSPNDTINGLLLRPIVSNIGTATYHLSKYLAELLSPLSESEYTIKNTKYFPEKNQERIWWWWWWWWWWIVFVVWFTEERRLALFQAGTIVRDPHHRESLTWREQDIPNDHIPNDHAVTIYLIVVY